jgi:hypothetical protein
MAAPMTDNLRHDARRVRRPLFDGMQSVHALWFDVALIGEAEARRRVLRHWTPGARLHAVHDGLLLMLAAPLHGQCAQFDGLPLCEHGGIVSSAPLAADERAATPPASVWLVHGAQARLVSLAAAPRIDPAAWLDLGAIVLHAPLLPPRASATTDAGPLAATPVRAILGDAIPPPSAGRDDFLKQVGQARRSARAVPRAAGIALAAVGMAAVLMGAVPFGLIRLVSGGKRQATAPAASAGSPRAPSALGQRLAALAARLAMLTRASTVIGWRQAAYLRKMLNMFERGDIGAALRHAIPLGAMTRATRPAFGPPSPRTGLKISGPGGTRSAIGLDGELEQYLRTTYRRTFERLDREGRIDEATFVLAELLNCGAEAVDYLEKKGRIQQAAQLAETMALAPEIAVRLWCTAGDVERAVRLARLGQAFGTAVLLLEREKSTHAPALRLLWAEDLAQRGRLVEAAEAIWPLPDQHGKALAWLQQAEHAGGIAGMRALLKKLVLLPDSLAASAPALLRWLDDDSAPGAQQRQRLAMELLALAQHAPSTRRVAAELLRPLLADRMAKRNDLDKQALARLLALSGDAVLQADLPQLSLPAMTPAPGLTTRAEPLVVHLAECGLLAIHDARRLEDGDYLLALGEGGVIRIDRHGRQLAQFPVPATRLVMADGDQRALALVQRGDRWRVSRIDLLARKVSDWLIAPLSFWSDNYDGLFWNAVLDNRLVAIDTSADQLSVSWQVADLPGQVIAFLEERGTQTLLLSTSDDIQQWRYQLPARRLLQRDSFPHPRSKALALLPHSAHAAPAVVREVGGPYISLQVQHGDGAAPFTIALQVLALFPEVVQTGGFLLINSYPNDDDLLECLVADGDSGKVLARLSLDQCTAARVHLDDGHILLFDQAGRLIDIGVGDSSVHTLTLA